MSYKVGDIVYVRKDAIKHLAEIENREIEQYKDRRWLDYVGKCCEIEYINKYIDREIYFMKNANGFYIECLGCTQVEEILDIEAAL